MKLRNIRRIMGALSAMLALAFLAGCAGNASPASSDVSTGAATTVTGGSGTSADGIPSEDGSTHGLGSLTTGDQKPGSTASATKGKSTTVRPTTASTTAKEYGDVKAQMYLAAASPDMSGVLTVDPSKVVNANIIGGGINFAFSDYVYYDYEQGAGFCQTMPFYFELEEIESKRWEQFFRELAFTGTQYVRLQVNYTQWEPINDNNDPFNTDFDKGFIFSPNFKKRADAANVPSVTYKYMQLMYKVLDQFEKMGCYVILGNWDSFSANGFCPDRQNWLLEDNATIDRHEFYVKSADEHAETYAAIMYHLIKQKGYTCVKGFSVYNEPENMDNIERELTEIYTKCDQQLKRLGIRDKVTIQAFDGGVTWTKQFGLNTTALERLLKACPQGMNAISQHYYPKSMEGLREGVEKVVSLIGNRPYIAGEMGYQLLNDGSKGKNFGLPLFNCGQIAEFFNGGGKAYGLWAYNSADRLLDDTCYYSMLTSDPDNKYGLIPDKVNFYSSSLMIKYLPGGTNIVSNTLSGCHKDGAQQVYATVGVKNGQTTILLVNNASEPAAVKLSGVNTSKTYRCHYVAEGQSDRIYPGGTYDLAKTKQVSLRPRSITVLTTYTYGTQTVR